MSKRLTIIEKKIQEKLDYSYRGGVDEMDPNSVKNRQSEEDTFIAQARESGLKYGALGGVEYGPRPECAERACDIFQVGQHEYYYLFEDPEDAIDFAESMGTEVLPEDEIMKKVEAHRDWYKNADTDML